MRPAYYNENDPRAAAWLRELISAELIAAGDVDERSIADVRGSDLRGYGQVHLFAGIGGWSAALRLAGVSDGVSVWTGSCPCQPLSVAGKRKGHEDERHLWPKMYRLIDECRPAAVFGEQVDSRDGLDWLDGVRADLEDAEYAFGSLSLNAAGVGSPHIRQRLYWVAYSESAEAYSSDQGPLQSSNGCVSSNGLANSSGVGRGGRCDGDTSRHDGALQVAGRSGTSGLDQSENSDGRRSVGSSDGGRRIAEVGGSGSWGRSYWHECTDGKHRRVPIESAFFPLVDDRGVSGRVGLLRGAGNAVVVPLAAKFIEIAMRSIHGD